MECCAKHLGRVLPAILFVSVLGAFPVAAQSEGAKGGQSPTADQARNSSADLDAMQKIRKAIVADRSLSTDAHNVKVISRDGVVTLRGPVRSESEKSAVEAKAADVVGASNVKNELTVKTNAK